MKTVFFQLFRMQEDGRIDASLHIQNKVVACRLGRPDGKRLVYVKQVNHSLSWLSDRWK